MYYVIRVRSLRGALSMVLSALILLTAVTVGTGPYFRAVSADAAEGVTVPIIMYHGVLEEKSRLGQYVISPQLLESDLAYLRDHGYTTVVMADLIAYADKGIALPDKPIVLTFDDGYYNNYRFAFPLLQQYGMRAVLSPIVYWTEFYSETEPDRPLYSHVTWDELREMQDSGVWEIQNHSYCMHYSESGKRKGTSIMPGESVSAYQAVLREDLTKAQERLKAHLGAAPTTMTFPFGAISREAMPVIEELGFRSTLTCTEKVNTVTRDPESLIGLGRFLRPNGKSSAAYFDKILS